MPCSTAGKATAAVAINQSINIDTYIYICNAGTSGFAGNNLKIVGHTRVSPSAAAPIRLSQLELWPALGQCLHAPLALLLPEGLGNTPH